MNPGATYGHMINFNPNAFGTYCGEGMMCMGSCKPAADSHLPASALSVVPGGWGTWSSFTGIAFCPLSWSICLLIVM